MTFDIINISAADVARLTNIELKLLRTAQQKKNELTHKFEADCNEFKMLTLSNNTFCSSIFNDKISALQKEYDYQVEILKEQLLFNMQMKEPTYDGETGGSGMDSSGYLVDYELSYLERYTQVRDYYFSIEDPVERLNLYAKDSTAMSYLGSYYNTLFNYMASFTY